MLRRMVTVFITANLVVDSFACAQIAITKDGQLLAEAEKEAARYWADHLSKCGDSYIALNGAPLLEVVQEESQVTFGVTPRVLSEADRLNGIEWDGEAWAVGKAFRTRSGIGLGANSREVWSEWKSWSPEQLRPRGTHGGFAISLVKTGGIWKAGPGRHDDPQIWKPFPCNGVPGVAGQTNNPAQGPRPSTIVKPQYADYKDVEAFDRLAQQTISTESKLAEIDRMIARGFDLNGQTSDLQTPIRSLMDYGQAELIAPLVARGLSLDPSMRSCADQFWFAQRGVWNPRGLEVLAAFSKAGFREDCLSSRPGDQGFVCSVMFGSAVPTFDVSAAVKAVDGIASLGFNVGAKCGVGKTIVESIEENPDQAARQRLEAIATAIRRRTMK